jgi:pimeloyl-ACP methyl ester carboxylesterase
VLNCAIPGFALPDGRRLAYRASGSGEPLICHPGGPGAPSGYLGDLGGLSTDRALVVLDPRGTGASDPPASESAYRLADYVEDLEALRAELGLARSALCGHSHGSHVALAYAATYPERVTALVLIATSARFRPAELAAMEAAMAGRAAEPWYADARAAIEADIPADDAELGPLMARALPFYFARYGPREAEYARAAGADRWHGAALRWFNDHEFGTLDLRSLLPRVAARTLIVTGERDFILGPAGAQEVADGVPGATPVVMPHVGHFPWFEAPHAFRSLVSGFLDTA